MKKPKYTRNPVIASKVPPPRLDPERRLDSTLRVIYYYESRRNRCMDLLKNIKTLKRNDVNRIIALKQNINEIIKHEKRILKSIQRKHRLISI